MEPVPLGSGLLWRVAALPTRHADSLTSALYHISLFADTLPVVLPGQSRASIKQPFRGGTRTQETQTRIKSHLLWVTC